MNIQPDPVRRDTAADLDPHCTDFAGWIAITDPDARIGGRGCLLDAEAGAGFDHGRFKQVDVSPCRKVVRAEIDDCVGYQLARAVVGQVAATGGRVERGECLLGVVIW